jgi:hypothetical protein
MPSAQHSSYIAAGGMRIALSCHADNSPATSNIRATRPVGAAAPAELDAGEAGRGRAQDRPEAHPELDGTTQRIAEPEEPEEERRVIDQRGDQARLPSGGKVVRLVWGEVGREGEQQVERDGSGYDRPRAARDRGEGQRSHSRPGDEHGPPRYAPSAGRWARCRITS